MAGRDRSARARDVWTGPTDSWGFATVGVEALARAPNTALVMVDPVPPDALTTLDRSALWRALPAVRSGRVLHLLADALLLAAAVLAASQAAQSLAASR